MMNKFVLWNLTQYERIMYFDGDAIPIFNIDYLLQLSNEGIFHPTVILAGPNEPGQGGLFVLKPSSVAFRQVRDLIQDWNLWQFNSTFGWGHVFGDISPPSNTKDTWESNRDKAESWSFYGASADQGLLYHFPKYVQGKLTQILARKIVNYDYDPRIRVLNATKTWNVGSISESPLTSHMNKTRYQFLPKNCKRWTRNHCVPPYSDHAHFTMMDKPWKYDHNLEELDVMMRRTRLTNSNIVAFLPPKTAVELWWQTLFELRQYEGINVSYYIPTAQKYAAINVTFVGINS
mmetsp:Transcript_8956/g.25174  ORF Transcript_8956/g.25174 Transcript_8956/m.25174 type:complete len:290 (-) Transcript_8956:184-1053(-)